MKTRIFILFATVALLCACASDGEQNCYEFTIEKKEVTVSGSGTTERKLPSEAFTFCGMTDKEAAEEARGMSKVSTEEKTIDGEVAQVTTTETATYSRV